MFGSLSAGARQDLNKIARGYYRTDDKTTQGICNVIGIKPNTKHITLFDPCCGEGIVLSDLQQFLSSCLEDQISIDTYGMEIDGQRYLTSCEKLTQVLHGDALYGIASSAWASLLFFNPPYGYTKRGIKNVRLEQLFWEQHANRLMPGGLLCAILPVYLFYRDAPIMTDWLARYLEPGQTRIYRASTDQFQQIVILGYRRISKDGLVREPDPALRILLDPDATYPDLPSEYLDTPLYEIPEGRNPEVFRIHALSKETVQHMLEGKSAKAFFQEFKMFLVTEHATQQKLRSVGPLREGHIPALLASGGLDGIVADNNNQYLVRGTVKTVLDTREPAKEKNPDTEENGDSGSKNHKVTITTRRHETRIMAWDMDTYELLEVV
ncbi:DUF6094 domain-containing protein [Acidithiobacillus caldus]|uniref:DUF6094 domain-containing protein n=1 Tax=Acidithiobacillus caldus TaxID=33059 RepID=A0A1E7Z1B9_9PROT|nr:DUF6094 domain-containing protein [Acidithiobacillus caldus]OFC30367.1 hypothetical protein BAE27_11885 [Acidithiobacillus caldus]OFC30684.1 hypothetical protein BAE28_13140 [Acidithiobacillus caldus]OFC35514.1 hypothetical protein BAE29_15285 [Acidithiobacillus caldus]OFC62415.1 hypothetical protein BAE30_02005 [Acidithiobacillus caldus]